MKPIVVATACAFAVCLATAVRANEPPSVPELSAAQIVEKNVAARGGADAWRKIETMAWTGHIETANAPPAGLPFLLELKRPNKTHFEIKAQNQLALRIFDGTTGWKVKPQSSGKPEIQPFSNEEISFAQDGQGIDGPLFDYAAKGIVVTRDGVDEIEGRKAYRLKAKLPSGVSQTVWIDAENFLDVRYDRPVRNASGRNGTLSVVYRNYRNLEGLQIPLTIETGTESSKVPDRMVIDRIALNPPFDEQTFAKPQIPGQHRRNSVTVDTRSPPPQTRPTAWPPSSQAVSGGVRLPSSPMPRAGGG